MKYTPTSVCTERVGKPTTAQLSCLAEAEESARLRWLALGLDSPVLASMGSEFT